MVTLRAQDSHNNTTEHSFEWVIGQDEPPRFSGLPPSLETRVGDPVDLTIRASDPERDPLVYQARNLPAGLTLDSSTGEISGKTVEGKRYETTFIVKDEIHEVRHTEEWIVKPNQPPRIDIPGVITRSVNESVSYTISASDPEGDLPLEYSIDNLPDGLQFNQTTGEIFGTPTKEGRWQGVVTVRDHRGAAVQADMVWDITPVGLHGLVGWWKFDEGVGSTVTDASGNGNVAEFHDANGVQENGGWTAEGRIDGALQLDCGSTDASAHCKDIVVIPMSDSLRAIKHEITVMAWTYRTARRNVAVLAHNYPKGLFFGYHEYTDGDKAGTAVFKWGIDAVDGSEIAECWQATQELGQAPVNRWYHLTGVFDGQHAKLYVNGTRICTATAPEPVDVPISEHPITISGFLDSGDGPSLKDEIIGKIDDVRVYNRALSDAEILEIYQQAPPLTPPPDGNGSDAGSQGGTPGG